MSKARAKGTQWENELVARLSEVLPDIDRAPLRGIHDRGDFVNTNGWVLEAKNHLVPHLIQWCNTTKAKGFKWAVIWSGGDRRKKTSPGPTVMVSLETFIYLIGEVNDIQEVD